MLQEMSIKSLIHQVDVKELAAIKADCFDILYKLHLRQKIVLEIHRIEYS